MIGWLFDLLAERAERGEQLYRHCVAKLDAAHGRIEELGSKVREAQP